jgi:hypothetical protein
MVEARAYVSVFVQDKFHYEKPGEVLASLRDPDGNPIRLIASA